MNTFNSNLWFISHLLISIYLLFYIFSGISGCFVVKDNIKCNQCISLVSIHGLISFTYMVYMYRKRDEISDGTVSGTISNFIVYVLYWVVYFHVIIAVINMILLAYGISNFTLQFSKVFEVV